MRATPSAIRVVLADDHPVVLSGLKALIQADTLFKVIAQCSDGCAALKAIQELKPELAILDISMPGLSGIEVLTKIEKEKIDTRVIFLTASVEDSQLLKAVKHGAFGLVLKDAAVDELLESMHAALEDQRSLPTHLIKPAMEREQQRRDTVQRIETVLSPREQEIVLLVAEGRSNKGVAKHIGVTEGTVKIHLNRIYQKLGVNNRETLVALALQWIRASQ